VARICRSQSSKGDQFRQGRGSIPRFGIISFVFGSSQSFIVYGEVIHLIGNVAEIYRPTAAS
jgi:hypothetical protein